MVSNIIVSKKEVTYSELMPLIEDSIRQGQELDVSKLRNFLLRGSNIPLYCVGSGGFALSMFYCACLYSTNMGMSQAVTPLMMNHVSDETLKNSKVLIYSRSGSQIDTGYICKRMAKLNPEGLSCIGQYTTENKKENTLVNQVRKVSENWNLFPFTSREGFISPLSALTMATAIYKAFTNENPLQKIKITLDPKKNFLYTTLRGHGNAIPLNKIKNFITVYGGWGKPAAQSFESIMTESGIANVQLCDLRNWCHGRFIFMSNHLEDSALVLFVTPREKTYIKRLFEGKNTFDRNRFAFPDEITTIVVETDFNDSLAPLQLAIQSYILIDEIAKSCGTNPLNPDNKGKFDKVFPRNLKMTEQGKDGSVSLRTGKAGTFKGVSAKKVIVYNPELSVEEIAKKNNTSVANVRKYIKENHIDRQRDNQLLLYLKIKEILGKQPDISVSEMCKNVNCTFTTAKHYMQLKCFDIPPREGYISLVHDETLKKDTKAQADLVKKLDMLEGDVRTYKKNNCFGFISAFESNCGVVKNFKWNKGECSILSNMYACHIEYNGLHFHSVEQMFHYYCFADTPKAREYIMKAPNAKSVKTSVKTFKEDKDYLQKRWKILELCLLLKHKYCSVFRQKLEETGTLDLVEVTPWDDCDYGTTDGKKLPDGKYKDEFVFDCYIGRNGTGRIMMKVREYLRLNQTQTAYEDKIEELSKFCKS